MSENFASSNLADQLDPASTKLGDAERAPELLQSERVDPEPCRWHEKDGIIYVSVVSDGTTGAQWITRLKKRGITVSTDAENMLLSTAFIPTNGKTHKIAILKNAHSFFKNKALSSTNIYAAARHRNLTKPNAEVACLLRAQVTHENMEAMGVKWIVVMHEHINVLHSDRNLLGMCGWPNEPWLAGCVESTSGGSGSWREENSFAFLVSSTSPET